MKKKTKANRNTAEAMEKIEFVDAHATLHSWISHLYLLNTLVASPLFHKDARSLRAMSNKQTKNKQKKKQLGKSEVKHCFGL